MKRFTTFATAAALTLTTALPALASDQLANSLGVNVDDYSQAELTQLMASNGSEDRLQINAVIDHASADYTKSSKGNAYSASVDGQRYTSSELATLKAAGSDDDRALIRATESHAAYTDDGQVSAAREQLAASLGVSAAEYSLADLAAMKAD